MRINHTAPTVPVRFPLLATLSFYKDFKLFIPTAFAQSLITKDTFLT